MNSSLTVLPNQRFSVGWSSSLIHPFYANGALLYKIACGFKGGPLLYERGVRQERVSLINYSNFSHLSFLVHFKISFYQLDQDIDLEGVLLDGVEVIALCNFDEEIHCLRCEVLDVFDQSELGRLLYDAVAQSHHLDWREFYVYGLTKDDKISTIEIRGLLQKTKITDGWTNLLHKTIPFRKKHLPFYLNRRKAWVELL